MARFDRKDNTSDEIKVNGRYTDEFKEKLRTAINKGYDIYESANYCGLTEVLGSGFRQLFYKIKKEETEGVVVDTLRTNNVELVKSSINKVTNSTKEKVTSERKSNSEVNNQSKRVSVESDYEDELTLINLRISLLEKELTLLKDTKQDYIDNLLKIRARRNNC